MSTTFLAYISIHRPSTTCLGEILELLQHYPFLDRYTVIDPSQEVVGKTIGKGHSNDPTRINYLYLRRRPPFYARTAI